MIKQSFPQIFMYQMHKMYVLIQKQMEKKLTEQSLVSFSQFWVLVCLVNCNETKSGNVSAGEVARRMYVSEATVSRHIERLIKQKLITKKRDKINRRKYLITLTPQGEKQFLKAKKVVDKEMQEIFKVVESKDEVKITNNFNKILEKLIKENN